MLIEKLQELGFSEKEAAVYLALAEFGSAIASDIAKKAGINRSTTYIILESLADRGLVSVADQQGIRQYISTPPERLIQYLQKQAKRYTHLAETAKKIVRELPSPDPHSTPVPKVQLFQGEKGIKTMYEDTLATLEEIRVHAEFGHEDRKMAKPGADASGKVGIKMRTLLLEQPRKGKKTGPDQDAMRETLLASREKTGISSEINIYDDRVVFISGAEDFALVVESSELADALKKAFAVSEPEKRDTKKVTLRSAFSS